MRIILCNGTFEDPYVSQEEKRTFQKRTLRTNGGIDHFELIPYSNWV